MLLLLIGLVVVAVTLSVYQVNARYYLRQDAHMEQSQNLKVALNSLSREIRMAGNVHKLLGPGVKTVQIYVYDQENRGSWFQHTGSETTGVRPVFGLDGGPFASDRITLFSAEIESGLPFGRLAAAYDPGAEESGRLKLREPLSENNFKPGDIVAVSYGDQALILEACGLTSEGLEIILGDLFRPAEALPAASFFPAGSYVYNLKKLNFSCYYIDKDRDNLMVQYYDQQFSEGGGSENQSLILASRIEDLQIRYIFDDGSPLSISGGLDGFEASRLDDYSVKLINLALMSKSSYRNKSADRVGIPGLFNRRPRLGDNYQRQIMNESIAPMNF